MEDRRCFGAEALLGFRSLANLTILVVCGGAQGAALGLRGAQLFRPVPLCQSAAPGRVAAVGRESLACLLMRVEFR